MGAISAADAERPAQAPRKDAQQWNRNCIAASAVGASVISRGILLAITDIGDPVLMVPGVALLAAYVWRRGANRASSSASR